MRPHGRTEHIEHFRIFNPLAQGFVHGFLEGALAALGSHHARTEHLHADDIEVLALHIHFTHADGAFQPHQGRCGRSGHPMLACAGFRNNALLAHALCQQALPKGIVDLVRAQMVKVFALEPYLRAAKVTAQIGAVEYRIGPPSVVGAKIIQLFLEGRIRLGGLHGFGHFVQTGLERLGYELPAVGPKKALAVRNAVGGGMLAHAISFFMLGFCKYRRPARNSAYERPSGGGIKKTPSLWRVARAMSRCRPRYPRRAGLFRLIRALRGAARNLARRGALPYSLPLLY